jgi:hypothetical protein
LKCFISFEAIIVLLIGLSSLSGTIYIDVNHSLFFGTLDDVVGVFFFFKESQIQSKGLLQHCM